MPGLESRPSVREVSLLGISRSEPGWAAGDRLRWGGRWYRIVGSATPLGRSIADDGETRYIFLMAGALSEAARNEA
jgi:hypothetical protein